MAYLPNDKIQYKDNTGNTDAFGRLRVSTPFTIFDSKQLADKQTLFWDEVLTGSVSAHTASLSWTGMHTPASSGSLVIRQTRQRFNYQPGKSQLVLMTGVMSNESNVEKSIGYCSGDTASHPWGINSGLFFRSNGTTVSVNISLNGVITSIAQANWNIDKMDGTGASGVTLDFTKTQIFVVDFEWLGVGRVRFGFVVDGKYYYCHEFLNTNSLSTVYMRSPNQAIRYEIRSLGGAGSLYHICSSVMSEGSFDPNGTLRSVSTESVAAIAANADTAYLLCGVRLGTGSLDETIIPEFINTMATTADNYRLVLAFNPVLTGSVGWVPLAHNSAEITSGSGASISANPRDINSIGVITYTSYVSDQSRSEAASVSNSLRLGSRIDGTRDILCLMAIPVAGSTNLNVYGTLNFRSVL